ncbi:class I SAM-dependent methyltransferase [Pseudoduganella chitinolytica]|uniref:Class I SAM-dependent methyltransferase n=1 Tax=Pseudoduganella chitinolytica TaxID=34070 RepID=A0ABY8BAK6_9BURK|nr:class I SAM-dependent methyltransferase [Pseudoduganella chitinolytica]WEF32941.1 class I SAM-dependent methyltransferase [Pseudoduganella chitinolytica]
MSGWSAGYVADVGYTFGLYPELNPLRIRLAFLNMGLVFPETGTACELGFGQGVSVNVHAAASGQTWHGTDFNPAQAGFARELAAASGANVQLTDAAFAEFCARDDLPDFDFICMHGIWSWISDENRHVLVDFLRRKLKVGGVLYISYNTQPGWAAMVPVRELMTQYHASMTVPGAGMATRVEQSLQFAERLFATNPSFVQTNALIPQRMAQLRALDKSYLAHEYFNRDWQPMSFPQVRQWLEPAKLDFACSATYIEHVESIILTPDQAEVLNTLTDPALRQLALDFVLNQQFRRDYWVRGKRQLTGAESSRLLRQQYVVLAVPASEVVYSTKVGQLELSLKEAAHKPVIDVLADHRPRTIGEIEAACASAGMTGPQVFQAVFMLAGTQQIQPAQDPAVTENARAACFRLNGHLIARAGTSGDVNYLASAVTGGGVPAPRIHQLFLLGLTQGKKNVGELVPYVMAILSQQNVSVLHEGKPATQDQQFTLLERQAGEFLQRRLPVLKALAVVP